ncbi:hypothetical protein F442_15020 [Phytophthora nicotianae P10297]|uniref:Uncharacterized protein n=4 Tax=Phytophthora nicotianae TaxID=4792 RepID=V9EJ28_PHYNI|nr:hypothetical protein F443_15187 [Phytophthora nicotianae P1569]ETL32859.1 hypothetical protein L916_14642 [Phytophthora nicotianae]ETM39268.1 hypothetical protein L914_14586 [Phytophthora nicotianae]ETO67981.1 hypothetical protein F444_15165 [Phytophthora nicotianae P1976]ETP37184.1 hypothetical protein F442_15020 [Phytophthora nicotianae P10297]
MGSNQRQRDDARGLLECQCWGKPVCLQSRHEPRQQQRKQLLSPLQLKVILLSCSCYLTQEQTSLSSIGTGKLPTMRRYRTIAISNSFHFCLKGSKNCVRCSRAESVGTSSKFVKTTEVIQTYVENHFTESVKQGDTLSVRRVLRPNADVRVNVDHTDCDGTPLLILAASRGGTGVVKTLVDAGANVNQSDRNGSTALIQAATNGHAAIVMILLNAKANADLVKCDNGWTALMAAAHEGHHKIVSILVRYGAPLDLVCHNDNTALMHAMSNGHGDIALVLLNAGADFSIVNKQGKTARAVARSNNHSEAARVLESFTTDPHFFEYVKSGDIHAVQQCVTYNLNIRDTVGATPILAAATQPSSDSETPGI